MIRVNLLGEQEERAVGDTVEVVGYALALLLSVLVCYGIHQNAVASLEELRTERAELSARLAKLEQLTKDVGELEEKRAHLQERLKTIAYLKSFRHGPVQVLDAINKAIPMQAWLTGIGERDGLLEIKGIALDNHSIARFIQDLAAQKGYLGEIELVESVELQMCTKPHKTHRNSHKGGQGEGTNYFDGVGVVFPSEGLLQHVTTYHGEGGRRDGSLKEFARDMVKLKRFTLAVQLLDPITQKPRSGANPESMLQGGSARHRRGVEKRE